MKSAKKTGASSNMTKSEINPTENPVGAIDQYMPLPDEIYKKWKSKQGQ